VNRRNPVTDTHAGVLVTAAVLVHLDAIRQLVPFVRLDGYYIVSDLAGVPDLFSRMGPALHATLPGRRSRSSGVSPAGDTPGAGRATRPRLTGLTRRARVMVAAWALLAAPLLLANLLLLVVSTPFVLTRTSQAVQDQLELAGRAIRGGEPVTAFAEVVSVLVVALPAAGMVFVLVLLGRGMVRAVVASRSRGRPRRVTGLSLAVVLGALVGALVASRTLWGI
jgi:putative peptide zinc metalloprotease protein